MLPNRKVSSKRVSVDPACPSPHANTPAAPRRVSRRRTVLATWSGSTAVTVIVAVQALVLAPLFLRELGAPLYGAWLASGELLVWLQAFDLGLPNLLIQRIGAAEARHDRAVVGEYLASGLLVLGTIAIVVAGAVVLLAPSVPWLMRLDGSDARTLSSAIALAGVATAATLATNAVVGFARGIQRTGMMSAVTVVSVLAGFGTTLGLLLGGWGLWAAAMGIAVRSSVFVLGAGLFVAKHLHDGLSKYFRIRLSVCREVLAISPVTALGGLAYAGMNQTETALVAVMGRPDLAAAYALTRRAADLARALIDMIGAATYGSFAHLAASAERSRSLTVHAEVTSLRLSLAVVAAGAYVAVNASLVGAWVGPTLYMGLPLTFAFALQMIVVGHGYLLNYLYRATGAVAAGSWMLFAEALIRVPLMAMLFIAIGTLGVPLAGIMTAAVFGAWALSRTCRDLSDACARRASAPLGLTLARIGVVVAGGVIGTVLKEPSWLWSVTVGLTFAAMALPLLTFLDPRLAAAVAALRLELPNAPPRLFSR